MLNIINHSGHENQDHNEITLHNHQDGYSFLKKKIISVDMDVEK